MRCVDVIRELATSRTETLPDVLAEHLAGCPRCADWARQAARLDRLWEATRPAEPSSAVWDMVWAQVCHAADAVPAPAPAPLLPFTNPVRPWRRAVIAALGIAQAAAILVGTMFLIHTPTPVAVAKAEVNIDTGPITFIKSDPGGITVVSIPLEENSNSVDPGFVALGYFEAMAD